MFDRATGNLYNLLLKDSGCHLPRTGAGLSKPTCNLIITGLLIGCGKNSKIMWKFLAILCINMR